MTDTEILDAILRREGGYVYDASDRGGCTNRGITLATLKDWRQRPTTCGDVKAMTESEARAIYTARYLQPFAHEDPAVKAQIVDIAVMSGVGRALTMLEVARRGPRPLPVQLAVERLKFYARIVRDDPSQARFILGWVIRATEFL
jgi:lysozyme family protein